MKFSNSYILESWPGMLLIGTLTLLTIAHVLLHKDDPRSAAAWSGFILMVPGLGPMIYFVFGINRMLRRQTKKMRGRLRFADSSFSARAPEGSDLAPMKRLMDRITERPLVKGNRIEALDSGEAAFERMLLAIGSAKKTITFMTYIFGNDPLGLRFVAALKAAQARGVEIRLLIDDVGAKYSLPSIFWALRRAGVPYARFLKTRMPGHFQYSQLRNHRKIIVLDGTIGFFGGMNIRQYYLSQKKTERILDLHFELRGPVVLQLQEIFAEDWHFTTGETLSGELWFPPLKEEGPILARAISDGPDEDYEKLRLCYLGAINSAQKTLDIATPYFLPDDSLISSLCLAALRGVRVRVFVPKRGNLRLVEWASWVYLERLLDAEVEVYLTPEPFDHSKLVIMDGAWALFGSGNWDMRSLKLNFESNLECYDRGFCMKLVQIVEAKVQKSRRLTLKAYQAGGIFLKLRNRLAWLLSPYL